MTDDRLQLRAGPLEMVLSPSLGGSIQRFDWVGAEARRPILRGCDTALKNVLDAASFPLVPYVNRIRGGRFSFRGREVRIAPNMAGDISPLHGQGWLSAWRVEEARETGAFLAFDHPAGEWPWTYEAKQRFELDDGGLSLELKCRNISDERMPCGLGQHPYFPCSAATRLDTAVEAVWTIDDNVLPVGKEPAEGRYDLRHRFVCGQHLDHGFSGWSGRAIITDPDWPFDLVLSSPTARFFQLYSPEQGGIFVAEPVTHANAALNAPEAEWDDLGMRVLDPGEQMSLAMRLDVIAK